ncbi:MAG: FHA domain-containing protein, partial [Acidimicrobiales bacterium]
MQDLEITWPDGVERFSVADSPIHLGRSSQAAIPLTESSVSRRHLELAWNGTTWVAKDSSTHGTYDPIGVRLAPEWSLTTDTTVRLGGPEGVQVQIRPVGGPAVDIDLVSEIGIARPRPGAN